MWIELHDSVIDHPKILKLTRDLASRDANVTRTLTVGLVCTLWVWTLRLAPDGNLSSFDSEDIANACGWLGDPDFFVECLVRRRLLDTTDVGLIVHDFDEYHGSLKSAERSRRYRDRKRASRDANVTYRDANVTDRDRHCDQTDQTDQTHTTCRVPKPELDGARSRAVAEVLAHYRTYHPRALPKPTTKSKEVRAIVARLAEGYTADELKAAIDGMHRTPHNLGENDRGQKYLGLELCMRDSSHVTRFIEAPQSTQPARRKSAAEQAREADHEFTRRYNERIEQELRERGGPDTDVVFREGNGTLLALPG